MNINTLLIIVILNTLLTISCGILSEDIVIENNKAIEEKEVSNVTYDNIILNNNIKTVLCHKKNKPFSLPIINLNTEDNLSVSFDDIEGDIKNYFYTIIHCDSEWNKSNLIDSEYLYGFQEEPISNYKFSFNTIQKYTHYKFDFPTNNMKPILSGNYVFKIFEEGKKDKPIIYQRFMVLENKIIIDSQVKIATLASDRKTKHEIDFSINTLDMEIRNPYSEIKVKVTQNQNHNNNITNLKPIFIKNNKLIYDYEDVNTIKANNEFRNFDIKSLRYQSQRIKNVTFDSTYNHVFLFADKKRTFNQYSIIHDINGHFLIQKQEAWDSSVESDYAFVHFTLLSEKINYGDIFIIGGLSNWQLSNIFKMKYNYQKQAYEASIFLKQGYYNYMYALNDTITKEIDISYIEGSHYQTKNIYYIYVYYKKTGDKYDKLIGFTEVSSNELF